MRLPVLTTIITFVVLLGFIPFLDAEENKLTPENLKAARREAAWKKRRILMNNDGNDSRGAKEKTREVFLASRTTPLIGSQVDTILYCDGIWGTFTHESPTAELRVGSDRGLQEWAVDLVKDGGQDPLGSILDLGHKNNIEVFWSLRMSDTHDSADPTMMSKWKKENPDCLVGKFENRDQYKGAGRRWSGVNYAKKKVRDRTIGWFDEVGEKYDVDGFELDFFRHLVFFKNPLLGEPATRENRNQMTEVVRRIREIADKHALRRGRPILVTVRLPDSTEYCKEVGLDIEQWLEEGLIDSMTVSGYFRLNPWKTSVDLGHRFDVPVYAGLSESRVTKLERHFKNKPEEYRARALAAWKEGVDGVYTFNLFSPRSPIFREIGDPVALTTMNKTYTTGSRNVHAANYWHKGGLKHIKRHFPLPDRPQPLAAGKPVNVPIDVWDDLKGTSSEMQAIVTFVLTGQEKTSPLEIDLNGHTLKLGKLSNDGKIECQLPKDHLKIGKNIFTFKLNHDGSKHVVLRDLYVTIKKESK